MAKGKVDISENVAQLAQQFVRETDVERLKEIAVALSKPGATRQAVSIMGFSDRLKQLVSDANAGSDDDRIRAIAVLGRLRQQAQKALDRPIREWLSKSMNALPSVSGILTDPADRFYFAKTLTILNFEGRDSYIAEFIVNEGSAKTQARSQAVIALLQSTAALADAFDLLSQALRSRRPDTRDPSETRARILIRILEASGEAFKWTDPYVSPLAGPAFAKLLVGGLGTEPIADRSTRIELASRALEVLTAFVRPNFSLVREPSSFDALRVIHKLFSPARWPLQTEQARAPVIKLLREAIVLLAQAGVTDNRLVELLTIATDAHASRAVLRTLAEETHGISNAVKHWLETGQAPSQFSSSEAVGETILEMADREIARAFREAVQLRINVDRISEMLLESVGQSPMLVDATKLLLRRIDELVRYSEQVASIRSMEVKFHVGDIVEFSPEEHEPERSLLGSRLVRIVGPQIIRRVEGRTPRIVLKALVVPEQ